MSAPSQNRALRVGDRVHRELAELLIREVSDPRLQRVTIAEVRVSKDLAHARVFVTLPAGGDADGIMRAFARSTGFLRKHLARGLRMRVVPQLRFVQDTMLDEASHIDELLAGVTPRAEPHDREREN